ncbi:MAG: hypothetical protein LUQ49_04085 [Methanomicrobiales archaeon]|nr:hypothetical protein [Methanomicrobiales archaeon]
MPRVSEPYLSVVVVTRNDTHGGDPLGRLQAFIRNFSAQCDTYHLPAELIIVEWNPPGDRESLAKALGFPTECRCLTIRIVTVPPEIHRRFPNSDRIPLYQMIGKNVGIRRARGRFILATNIDILFSSELIGYLAAQKLDENTFYRVDRTDVEPDIPPALSVDETLAFCRSHVVRRNPKYFLCDWANLKQISGHILKSPDVLPYYISNTLHKLVIPRLHYNACGDFTLMAREKWFALRGYPELPIFSLHIDSLLLMMAAYSGLKEKILPWPCAIYHMEHALGSGITPGMGQKILFERLDREKVPYLTWGDCIRSGKEYQEKLLRGEKEASPNTESWGLADTTLEDTTMCG